MCPELAPEILLNAYARGIFPMADETGRLVWLSPDPRTIIPLDHLVVSRSLRSTLRKGVFTTRVNSAFDEVIEACADRATGTWISGEIMEAYRLLHRMGFAHSVESWHDGRLAGGLYGVSIGAAFFGESMFHRRTDASKVALVALVQRMRARDFRLLDTQFQTPHLASLGARDIPRRSYLRRLAQAVQLERRFGDEPPRFMLTREPPPPARKAGQPDRSECDDPDAA